MGPRRPGLCDELLVLIANGEPLTMTKAAHLLGTSQSTVTKLLPLTRRMGSKRFSRLAVLVALVVKGGPLTVTTAAHSLGVDRAEVNRLRVEARLPWPCDACGRPVPFEQSYRHDRSPCPECAAVLAEAAAARRVEAERKKTHCRRCDAFIGTYRFYAHRVLCRPCGLLLAAEYQSVLWHRRGGYRRGFYTDGRRKYPVSAALEQLVKHGHDGP